MAIKVGINGFGRIGRMVFRAGLKNPNIEFVAVNDPFMTPDYMAYMLKYDTMHGRYDGTIEYTDDAIIVDGKKVQFFAEMDPKNIPWGKVGAQTYGNKTLLVCGDFPPGVKARPVEIHSHRVYSGS